MEETTYYFSSETAITTTDLFTTPDTADYSANTQKMWAFRPREAGCAMRLELLGDTFLFTGGKFDLECRGILGIEEILGIELSWG